MKYIPLLLMLSLASFAQKDKDRMPAHKLVWSDYKMIPPKDSVWSSMTGYEWSMDITTTSEGEVSADVHCYFLPYESWTRARDSATLSHEQGHLVIANAGCRQLNVALKAISGCKNCEETLNLTYQNAWQHMRETQEQYDQETEHHLNKAAQKKWDNQLKQIQ